MFGTLRYILAMLVVYSHYFPLKAHTWNWAGQFAVFSFYVLSGYLMTLVLNRRYGFSLDGLRRYLVNRALRIYPPYLLVAAMALTIIVLFPEVSVNTGELMRLPVDLVGWAVNIGILGIHTVQPSRFIPPAWSLSVELIYYVAMGVVLSRSRATVIAWFVASVAFTTYTVVADWQFAFRIATPSAASIAFSVGALLYHLPPMRPPRGLLPAAGAAFLLNAWYAKPFWPSEQTWGLYVSLVSSAVVIWCLSAVDSTSVPRALRRVDAFLGDLSYPIFLCHYPLAPLLIAVVFAGVRPGFGELFCWALPVIHVVAYLIHVGVERPMEAVRNRVRDAD